MAFLTVITLLATVLSASVFAQNNCGVPGAVINLKAENTTNTTTHLSWQPPASAECLDHYKITYCSYVNDWQEECSNKTDILPLNTNEYDVTGLQPCRRNIIQVHSVGKDNTETYIGILLYTGSGDPPKVENVNFKHVDLSYISIGWNTPANYSDQCYPGYKVCYTTNRDNANICSYVFKTEFSTSSLASSLSPCTEYNFSVATVDGDFAADSKTSEKTYASVVTAPEIPDIIVAVHNHTGYATWQALDTFSKTCAVRYEVKNCRSTSTESNECTTLSSQTLSANATEASITGLDSCTNNHISFNLVGLNGQSSSKEVVILDPDTEIPVPLVTRVEDVKTTEFIVEYFVGLNDCISSFRACWFTGSEAETCQYTNSLYDPFFDNLELKTCSNYTLHFTALGIDGKTSKNFTTTFFTGPVNALNLSTETSQQSILLTWNVAPSALQCGTNYTITWEKLIDDDYPQRVVLPVNATSYNITGLTGCAEYVVTFVTNGNNGTSSLIDKSAVYTTSGEKKLVNLTVEEDDTAQTLSLSWNLSPNNHQCVEYIEVTSVGDNKGNTTYLPSDATTYTLSNVTTCTIYYFELNLVQQGPHRSTVYQAHYTTSCSRLESLS